MALTHTWGNRQRVIGSERRLIKTLERGGPGDIRNKKADNQASKGGKAEKSEEQG